MIWGTGGDGVRPVLRLPKAAGQVDTGRLAEKVTRIKQADTGTTRLRDEATGMSPRSIRPSVLLTHLGGEPNCADCRAADGTLLPGQGRPLYRSQSAHHPSPALQTAQGAFTAVSKTIPTLFSTSTNRCLELGRNLSDRIVSQAGPWSSSRELHAHGSRCCSKPPFTRQECQTELTSAPQSPPPNTAPVVLSSGGQAPGCLSNLKQTSRAVYYFSNQTILKPHV